jgi:MFS transporter, putative metabolite:H+ symporter
VPTIGWRWLFVIGMLPALLAYIIRCRVPESPRWLAAHDRSEEALASLRYVGVTDAALRQAEQDIAAAPPVEATQEARFVDLFTRAYARRVVQTWGMWFLSNAGGYAFAVWLPTIYARIYHIQLTRTLVYTFIVAGTSVLGRIVAFWLVDRIGRKPLIVGGFLIAGCAALAFTQATTAAALLLVAMVFAFFNDIGALGMTVYTPEVFPLRIRGTATAAAMGMGRVGGMVSPIVIDFLLSLGTVTAVWFLLAAVQAGAALPSLWLAQETRGRNLEMVSHVA